MVYGSIWNAEDLPKDQETLKVDLNLLLVRRKPLTRRSYALSARSLGITGMNVLSSRRIRSPRSFTRVRRISWQHGITQIQKKKILKRSVLPLHSWPELRVTQKLNQPQRESQTLTKKMKYSLLFLLMNLKHVY